MILIMLFIFANFNFFIRFALYIIKILILNYTYGDLRKGYDNDACIKPITEIM